VYRFNCQQKIDYQRGIKREKQRERETERERKREREREIILFVSKKIYLTAFHYTSMQIILFIEGQSICLAKIKQTYFFFHKPI